MNGSGLERPATRDAHVAKRHAQLAAWATKMDALLARAARFGHPNGAGYRVRVDGLRARHATMQARLARFEAAETQTWADFKVEIHVDWQALELALDDLTWTA